MSTQVVIPFPVFLGKEGLPLSEGYVYIGVDGSNPETNPQVVYWDEALTIPAAQPIRTMSGFLLRNGSPAVVYVTNSYSITIRNKNLALMYSSLSAVGYGISTVMIPVVGATTLAIARDALGVSKKIKGYQAISISHLNDTSEPSIMTGSEIEVGGTFYEFPSDEAAVAGGWAAIGVSTVVYKYLVPAGAAHTWIYSATAPTWDTAKQGWYNGANRCFGMLYKDASGGYAGKAMMSPSSARIGSGIVQTILNAGSPYSAPNDISGDYLITTVPYTVNLPPSIGQGNRIRITNGMATTGLVTITPSGTDKIGPAGNVSIFLQNVDQSGAPYYFQFIELVDEKVGYWMPVGGQYCPHQTVDTDGQQYHLGKLHHLPLGNTNSRQVSFTCNVGAGAWYGSSLPFSGTYGVPTGAKGVRLRVRLSARATGSGAWEMAIVFSDNNSSTPTDSTAHPQAQIAGVAVTANDIVKYTTEIDVPLNSLGFCYAYVLALTNCVAASSGVYSSVVGYYMGD